MEYKIICDSCSDLNENLTKDEHFHVVPLTLQVGDYQILDDENFDQKDFLERMSNSSLGTKTACPSPELFKSAYETKAENVFVITISEHLSGTYQSAVIAKKLYEEENSDKKNIFVLSSGSASAAQFRLSLELKKLCEENLPFKDICEKITRFRDSMKTYFVLENLDNLKKNGRLSGLSAFFATSLNIKPVMGAVAGKIEKLDQARGMKKALAKMVEIAIKENAENAKDKIITISHVNNIERAKLVAAAFEKVDKFKEILITTAKGVATVYAGDGGVVIAIG